MACLRSFGLAGAGALVVAIVSSSLAGCTTYRDELQRGQRYYSENRFEQALAMWRHLEHDRASLEPKDRVRYAYYRGMTDFRLGFRSHARHWLAIARELDKQSPGGLNPQKQALMAKTLEGLNEDVYAQISGVTAESSIGAKSPASAGSAAPASTGEGDAAAPEGGGSPSMLGKPCSDDEACGGSLTCVGGACMEM